MLPAIRMVPALGFCLVLVLPAPAAGAEFQVLPERSHRLELPARQPDEKEFTKDTRIVAVDVYRDEKASRWWYVGAEGKTLAVVPSGKGEGGTAGKAKWLRRLVLPVRSYNDQEFAANTPKISVEVYRDERTGHRVHVSHTGALAVSLADEAPAASPVPVPKWLYRLPLKVRHYDRFETAYHRYNVEVYRDAPGGALLYVAGNGNLAVLPAARDEAGKPHEPPVFSHGLALQVRKPGADRFDPETTLRLGAEVYRDRNRGAWLYITENQQLAVVPGTEAIGAKIQAAHWLRGLQPPDAAAGWSAEVFRNPNTDHVIHLTSSGALAVVPQP
jgi:hypothetical protein